MRRILSAALLPAGVAAHATPLFGGVSGAGAPGFLPAR
jgi:hypothetical protein